MYIFPVFLYYKEIKAILIVKFKQSSKTGTSLLGSLSKETRFPWPISVIFSLLIKWYQANARTPLCSQPFGKVTVLNSTS